MIYGFSRHVVPRPSDWPSDCHVTGYWCLPDDAWTPPQALADFLAAGSPPVCIGFGSMLGEDAERLTALVVEGARRAGLRAVLLTGWGGLTAVEADDVVSVTEAPHCWLLPRTAAVVHHGGAGTTAAAVRAGVPSVVVPFAVDQPFWAARLHALGVAPAGLPVRHLTSDALAAALRRVTSDAALRSRARRLGELVSAEDGVGAAVTALERWSAGR